MCLNPKACGDPTSPGVWWRDDADWKQYDAAQAAAIKRGIADGAYRVDLGNVVSLKYTGGVRYVVDLKTMKQLNLASGCTRDVKVVEAPDSVVIASAADYDTTSVKQELHACNKLQLLENEAKRVAADAATAEQVADLRTRCVPGYASHSVSRDPVCKLINRCDPGEYWAHELYLSDDSEDDY